MNQYDNAITTLIVKHLPDFITSSTEIQNAYFRPYKPIGVRFMQSPAMPGFAFLDFPDRKAAEDAYQQLQKINFGLFYKTITVEYAKPDPNKQQSIKTVPYSIEQQEQAADPISVSQGLLYPSNPHLCYYYPDPTPEILNNITHAIGTVPRLYTQVLHLMNKFNMPPPFGPLDKESRTSLLTKRKHGALLASDESELEDDEEDENTTKQQEERIKQARLIRISAEKQKLVSRQQQQQQHPIQASSSGHKIKIVVGQQPNQEQQAIRDKCVPMSEWGQLPAFKHYEQGAPNAKVYVKNLSKHVTKEELVDIFSKFSKEIDVNLMTKGRLRGQAFITFPNVSAASLAVQCVNGYPLHDRPMAVLFGRETNTK